MTAIILFVLFMLFSFVILALIFIRRRIGLKIYNSEHGTNFKPHGLFRTDFSVRRFICDFTYFYWNVKPENKKLAVKNNIISAIIFTYILVVIITVNLYARFK